MFSPPPHFPISLQHPQTPTPARTSMVLENSGGGKSRLAPAIDTSTSGFEPGQSLGLSSWLRTAYLPEAIQHVRYVSTRLSHLEAHARRFHANIHPIIRTTLASRGSAW